MHTTNYTETFITVSPDSKAAAGREPVKAGTIAALHYEMISAHPYRHTSDDVIFGVHAERNGIAAEAHEAARKAFFSRGQACLRASPLVKSYGWGVHYDAEGRVALFGVETAEYARLAGRDDLTIVQGMRSKRA